MRPFFLTVEGWSVDRLADIDELAVIWPAREVAKVLLEVGEAGGAACEDGLGEGEVDHDVLDLVGVAAEVPTGLGAKVLLLCVQIYLVVPCVQLSRKSDSVFPKRLRLTRNRRRMTVSSLLMQSVHNRTFSIINHSNEGSSPT